jgi:hypothetical protein
MKHVTAILLLGILAFNWCGYRLYISAMEDAANDRLESRLDENDYDESELITVKIPAPALPYYTNSKFFERVDGRIEVNGLQYKYVKRRLYNDTIEILCISDHAATQLEFFNDNMLRSISDWQYNPSEKKNNLSHNSHKPLSDYCEEKKLFLNEHSGFIRLKFFSPGLSGMIHPYLDAPLRPPEIS